MRLCAADLVHFHVGCDALCHLAALGMPVLRQLGGSAGATAPRPSHLCTSPLRDESMAERELRQDGCILALEHSSHNPANDAHVDHSTCVAAHLAQHTLDLCLLVWMRVQQSCEAWSSPGSIAALVQHGLKLRSAFQPF